MFDPAHGSGRPALSLLYPIYVKGEDLCLERVSMSESASAVPVLDRTPRLTLFRVKPAVRRQLEEYVNDNDTSMRCAILQALNTIGVHVEPEDLVPERKRRLKPHTGDDTGELVGLSVSLPVYVRVAAELWMREHPGMRLVNMVLTGLKEMGFEIDDEDLTAKWTWKPFVG